MESVDQTTYFYSSVLYEKLEKLTKPLSHLGLNGFFYSILTTDGYCLPVSNRPDVMNEYVFNHLYIFNPFLCNPDNYHHNQMLMTSDFKFESYHKAQEYIDRKYGFSNFLGIYKKRGELTHILWFSTSDSSLPLSTICLNNVALLSHFGDHFLEEWQYSLHKIEPYMINIAANMGPMFFVIDPIFKSKSEKSKRLKLLQEAGILDESYSEFDQLTTRELSYLKLIAAGKRAREIANDLELSRRTVEHYIESIKEKLFCSSKPELIEKLQLYQKFKLF